jgi:hypothetical protein
MLTDVGDGTETGMEMLHDASVPSETPETVMVFVPLVAVTVPPHALVTLPETVIGDGRVNVNPTPDAVVSVCVFETNNDKVSELFAMVEANDASTATAWKFVSVYSERTCSPGVEPNVNCAHSSVSWISELTVVPISLPPATFPRNVPSL